MTLNKLAAAFHIAVAISAILIGCHDLLRWTLDQPEKMLLLATLAADRDPA